MFERLATALDITPALFAVFGFYLLAAVVYAWLWATLERRRRLIKDDLAVRLSWAPEAVIAPMMATPILLIAFAQQAATSAMATANLSDVSETKAMEAANGLLGYANSTSYGAIVIAWNAVLLGLIAAALVRQRLRSMPPPAGSFAGAGTALIIFAVLPLAGAQYLYAQAAPNIVLAPGGPIVVGSVGVVQQVLPSFVQVENAAAVAGIVALLLGASIVLLALVKSQPHIKDPRGPLTIVLSSIVLGGAVLADAMPYSAENSIPQDTRATIRMPTLRTMEVPVLRGPLAAAPFGPRIHLATDRVLYEDSPVEGIEEIDANLKALRRQEPRLFPGQARMQSLMIAVDARIRVGSLLALMEMGRRHDFRRYYLGFHHKEQGPVRPLLGPTEICAESWLEVSLEPGEQSTLVVTRDEPFEDLARRSIEAAGDHGRVHWRAAQPATDAAPQP